MGRNILLSTGSTVLALAALVVGVVAVASPYWATFENRIGSEDGHFGLWTVCRRSRRNFRCGSHVSRLQPSVFTTAAGACGAVAVTVTVIMCVTSPMVLAMRVTQRKVFVKFRTAIIVKLAVSCIGAVACVLSVVLFGIEMDAKRIGENVGFHVKRSWCFYLMVLFVLLTLALCACAAAEFVLARRLGGDPVTMARDPDGRLAAVIGNPAARAGRAGRGAAPAVNGVTVLAAPQQGVLHARPPPPATPTSSYNGRPIPYDPRKSPLRSSLKKKRRPPRESADESIDSGVMVIHNPGAGSPPAARGGKKVRINTLDTAV